MRFIDVNEKDTLNKYLLSMFGFKRHSTRLHIGVLPNNPDVVVIELEVFNGFDAFGKLGWSGYIDCRNGKVCIDGETIRQLTKSLNVLGRKPKGHWPTGLGLVNKLINERRVR